MSDAEQDVVAGDLFIVGQVIRPHGVKGELKVKAETEAPERWEHVERVFIGPSVERSTVYAVQNIRSQQTKRGPLILLKLEEVEGRDEATQMVKHQVAVHGDDLPPLAEDEVFIHELIGVTVQLEDGELVGSVSNVIQQPAHDVLVIEQENGDEVMVPAIDTFVLDVNMNEGVMTIRPIEGLLA